MEKYFEKFPVIIYNGYRVRDISARAVTQINSTKNPFVYYPYELKHDERPDQIADREYGDDYLAWLIYLSNDIVDPYYGWFIKDAVFNDFIVQKYGSFEFASTRVKYWRNNWYESSDSISVAQYTSLPQISKTGPRGGLMFDSARKYFEPITIGQTITSYTRKRADEALVTNRIISYEVTGNNSYKFDDIVNVGLAYHDGNTYSYSTDGRGQVKQANSSVVVVQHVAGTVREVPQNYVIDFADANTGLSSESGNVHITAIHSLANTILEAEAIYWSPVTYLEDEMEKNLKNKTIRLMDPAFSGQAAEELRTVMGG